MRERSLLDVTLRPFERAHVFPERLDEPVHGLAYFVGECETGPRNALRLRLLNQISTWLSREA